MKGLWSCTDSLDFPLVFVITSRFRFYPYSAVSCCAVWWIHQWQHKHKHKVSVLLLVTETTLVMLQHNSHCNFSFSQMTKCLKYEKQVVFWVLWVSQNTYTCCLRSFFHYECTLGRADLWPAYICIHTCIHTHSHYTWEAYSTCFTTSCLHDCILHFCVFSSQAHNFLLVLKLYWIYWNCVAACHYLQILICWQEARKCLDK